MKTRSRVGFTTKVATLPLLAGLSLLGILSLAEAMAARTVQQVTHLANGTVPALELVRDLEESLQVMQQAREDAAAGDVGRLRDAGAARDRILFLLTVGRLRLPGQRATFDDLRRAFERYDARTRTADLRVLTAERDAFRDRLAAFAARRWREAGATASAVRASHALFLGWTRDLAAVALLLLAGVSFLVVTSTLRSLTAEEAAAAPRPTRGEVLRLLRKDLAAASRYARIA